MRRFVRRLSGVGVTGAEVLSPGLDGGCVGPAWSWQMNHVKFDWRSIQDKNL